jgi:hypothetical protein
LSAKSRSDAEAARCRVAEAVCFRGLSVPYFLAVAFRFRDLWAKCHLNAVEECRCWDLSAKSRLNAAAVCHWEMSAPCHSGAEAERFGELSAPRYSDVEAQYF